MPMYGYMSFSPVIIISNVFPQFRYSFFPVSQCNSMTEQVRDFCHVSFINKNFNVRQFRWSRWSVTQNLKGQKSAVQFNAAA